MDGSQGTILWHETVGGAVRSSPALGDINGDRRLEMVIASQDMDIYALKCEDGTPLWIYPTEGMVVSSPVLCDINGDGQLEVVVGSYDGNVYALDGRTGAVE